MKYRVLIVSLLALCLSVLTACSDAASATGRESLTYEQIRGTGIANTCPEVTATTRSAIPLDAGKSYTLTGLCLQPTDFFVKEETYNKRQKAEFITAKLVTRETSTIDAVSGRLESDAEGRLSFVEEDGFDFQAITVQLPGGERVPFLFTIKNLVAQTQSPTNSINTSTDFEGTFKVPSYRTSNFLDPKGRGLTTGYDNAIALPAQADSEELLRENVKSFEVGQGKISLQVTQVDSSTGEIGGIFVSEQPSETDMGSREPSDVKIRGQFYARVESVS